MRLININSLLGLLVRSLACNGYLVIPSNPYYASITNYSQAELAGNYVLRITNNANGRRTDCNALLITLPITITFSRISHLSRGYYTASDNYTVVRPTGRSRLTRPTIYAILDSRLSIPKLLETVSRYLGKDRRESRSIC
jgi:hypothetical protein